MNSTTPSYSLIGDKAVQVPEELKDFTLTTKESSQVSYYGINKATGELYVQFKTGAGYIYPKRTPEFLDQAMAAESIGSFVIQNLRKPNAEFVKVGYNIQDVPTEDEDVSL